MNRLLCNDNAKAFDKAIKAIKSGDKKQALNAMDNLAECFRKYEDAIVFPYDDYSTETHLCTRKAFFSEFAGELFYSYTVYEWDGTYGDVPSGLKKLCKNEADEKLLRPKNWVEIFHTTSQKKIKLDKKYIDDTLKLLDILHKEHKNKENR